MEHHHADPDYEFWLAAVIACLEDMGCTTAFDASVARQLFEDAVPPRDAAVELVS